MPNENPQNKPPQRNGNGNGNGEGPPPRMNRSVFSWLIFIALAIMLFVMLNQRSKAPETTINRFERELQNGNVEEYTIKNETITGKYYKEVPAKDGRTAKEFELNYPVGINPVIAYERLDEISKSAPKSPQDVSYNPGNSMLYQIMVGFLPWLLIFGVIWFFLFRQIRQGGGGPGGMLGNFGRSRHRVMTREHTSVTFADVAGVEEAKDEVAEIVEFLKNPKRFQRLGGRIPRGVLLVGAPGCGKTMLAKAIAGEADVPFFSISGSDFVEMFVGVGASRVRDLFGQAKDNSPCIVFLDEIDAVGRRRGMGYSGGGHDEREQTLNAILVEMDGFDSNDQVIVVAATNRVDVLDPALTRPGRFDRQVVVPLPDVKGRFEILKVHAHKVKIQPPIEPKLHRIARGTPMFSGADLAAIVNESALLATLAGKDAVELDDLEEARDKVRWGRAKRSREVDEKERELTAYHEAGHALVQEVLEHADPVHKVSIIPRGSYGGATFSLPEKDRMTYNRSYLEAHMRVACAGRIAESLLGHDENSGASGDIKQATEIAKRMVLDWGMSEKLGFVSYGKDEQQSPFDFAGGKEFSEKTSEVIDCEVKRIVDEAYADTQRILNENRDKLEGVAKALLKYETIDGEEVQRIIAGEEINRPTVADLINAEQERTTTDKPPMARPAEPKSDSDDDDGTLPTMA